MKPKHKKAYMECASAFAKCSTATRLQVGAVIVKQNRIISCGYNAMPEHINDPCELPDGTTDPRCRHAEKNALMGLIRNNESAVGSVMFCNYAACELCAVDIVDAGVVEFAYQREYRSKAGLEHLVKSGVLVTKLE